MTDAKVGCDMVATKQQNILLIHTELESVLSQNPKLDTQGSYTRSGSDFKV